MGLFASKPQITHVIFDFDGILVDSEEQYSKMHEKVLAGYGKKFDLDQKLAIQGMRKSDEIQTMLKMNGLEGKVTDEEYRKVYCDQYEAMLSNVDALPGANNLIHHLHQQKVPTAICTSSGADEFEVKCRKRFQHWLALIPTRVLAGTDPEVKLGKPHPDPYLVAMMRFPEGQRPASPSNCLVFEDSVNGCKSALAAGMHCIMIPQQKFMCPATEKEIELLKPKLDDILESMQDFKPEKYGLPAFN